MKQYIILGTTPSEENCAQVGDDNYYEKAKKEARVFIDQIRREFGQEPPCAKLATKLFPHDFGSYIEVVCYYNDDDEESKNYAYKIDYNTPANWDEQSKRELDIL